MDKSFVCNNHNSDTHVWRDNELNLVYWRDNDGLVAVWLPPDLAKGTWFVYFHRLDGRWFCKENNQFWIEKADEEMMTDWDLLPDAPGSITELMKGWKK